MLMLLLLLLLLLLQHPAYILLRQRLQGLSQLQQASNSWIL
jgi:hypothetical protein